MSPLAYIAAGVVLGLLAATPLVLQLRGSTKHLTRGIVAVVFAFALIQGVLLLLHAVAPEGLLPVGVTSILCFIVIVFVESLRP